MKVIAGRRFIEYDGRTARLTAWLGVTPYKMFTFDYDMTVIYDPTGVMGNGDTIPDPDRDELTKDWFPELTPYACMDGLTMSGLPYDSNMTRLRRHIDEDDPADMMKLIGCGMEDILTLKQATKKGVKHLADALKYTGVADRLQEKAYKAYMFFNEIGGDAYK